MKNLVIGNTSQLSYYFPDNFIKISSRNIDFDLIKKDRWVKVFLCFGESRKFIDDTELYDKINFTYTLDVINQIYDYCDEIIIFSTCELWNRYSGQIDITKNFDFYPSSYILSKYKLTKHILDSNDYPKVKIIYPFNFNTTKRGPNFLFGKIFDSIINEKKISIGDINFYRDIIHPKFVVNSSLDCVSHKIVGSGRLVFVRDFVEVLYSHYGLSMSKLVTIETNRYLEYNKRKEYYLKSENCLYSYDELINDTINDINKIKK